MTAPFPHPERDGLCEQAESADCDLRKQGKRTPRERWRTFRRSPMYPATVLMFLIAAVAGLLAGTYSYVMAKPEPRMLPIALVDDSPEEQRFLKALDGELHASLAPHWYASDAVAARKVSERQVYAVVRGRAGPEKQTGSQGQPAPEEHAGPRTPAARDGEVELDVSGASGASVAEVLSKVAPRAAEEAGVQVRVCDIHPPQKTDPKGIALFYMTFAAVMVGFLGAGQLSAHAGGLTPGGRIGFTAGFAVLGGLCIYAVADWWLGVLAMPFLTPWLLLSLAMFASGMLFTMFSVLLKRWALLPTYGLVVLLGAPSCGGSVPTGLLPRPLATLGCWLPQGATVEALSSAVYFAGHQSLRPVLVLAGWATLSCAVFWTWRHRHPGKRQLPAAPAELAGGGNIPSGDVRGNAR